MGNEKLDITAHELKRGGWRRRADVRRRGTTRARARISQAV